MITDLFDLLAVFCGVLSVVLCSNNIDNDLSKISNLLHNNDYHPAFERAIFIDEFVGNASSGRYTRAGRRPDREDRYLNTTELLLKYGYPVQEHYLITEDGYNLTLIQVPGDGPVVFLMHGLLGSSDDFVVSGPDKALVYQLANASYDVWIGNARGNKYSRRHVRLNPEQRTFWEFSWHEIGIFDLPTMIDHALSVSQRNELTYIGHGQGTTVFFVLTSIRTEYNAKFNLMISLGTIAWTWHTKSFLIRSLIPFTDQFPLLFNLGFYELFPATAYTKFLTSVVCSSSRFSLVVCVSALFNLFGYDYNQIDYVNLPVQLSHFPAGSSLRQLTHFLQLAVSRRFAQFDYGEQENMRRYESATPPSYPVENITSPVIAFYSINDWLSSYDDAQILIDRLPNVVSFNRVPHTMFNHFDYIWARDIELLLYRNLLNIINGTVLENT